MIIKNKIILLLHSKQHFKIILEKLNFKTLNNQFNALNFSAQDSKAQSIHNFQSTQQNLARPATLILLV